MVLLLDFLIIEKTRDTSLTIRRKTAVRNGLRLFMENSADFMLRKIYTMVREF